MWASVTSDACPPRSPPSSSCWPKPCSPEPCTWTAWPTRPMASAAGRTREDILRIMRDHAIGSYGAVALVLMIALKITAIAALLERGQATPWLILAPVLGRWAIVPLCRFVAYARESKSVARHVGTVELVWATLLAAAAGSRAGPAAGRHGLGDGGRSLCALRPLLHPPHRRHHTAIPLAPPCRSPSASRSWRGWRWHDRDASLAHPPRRTPSRYARALLRPPRRGSLRQRA